MLKRRLIWQLYPSYLLIILLTVGLMFLTTSRAFEMLFMKQTTSHLKSQTQLLEHYLRPYFQTPQDDLLRRISFSTELSDRVTLMLANGRILVDSEQHPSKMDNHLNRPEVQDSLRYEWGISTRHSQTLDTPMLYVARAVRYNGTVIGIIRAAKPLGELEQTLTSIKQQILFWGSLICLISGFIGFIVSRRITAPIRSITRGAVKFSRGDFHYRFPPPKTLEFQMLCQSLNKMGAQLDQRLTTITKLETMRTEFVANVSHELKTPITLIKGFLETLSMGAVENPKERGEFLSIILNHTNRLDQIIDDLLSLSRIELDEDHISLQAGRLDLVIQKSINTCLPKATQRHITISFDSQKNMVAELNESLMEQAMINLIDNAIKYSPDRSHIAVHLRQRSEFFEIAIHDQGRGIEKEHLDHLFERFYRVDKARSRDLGGTGLGLSIVKHIVQAHQGFISVESDIGRGSIFYIFVPVVDGESDV